jgi:hypothetical protein
MILRPDHLYSCFVLMLVYCSRGSGASSVMSKSYSRECNVVIMQSNNWEKSDIFINCLRTLHCTKGRLEGNTSNNSVTQTVFCTSLKPQIIFCNGQRNGRFVWLVLQNADNVCSGRCNSLTPSHSFISCRWVVLGYTLTSWKHRHDRTSSLWP